MAEVYLSYPDGTREPFKERRTLGRGSPEALKDSGLSRDQCSLEYVEGLEGDMVISLTNIGQNCKLHGFNSFVYFSLPGSASLPCLRSLDC